MTRIQILSDTHSSAFEIDPSVDFAIHAGDITNYGFKRQSSLPWDSSLKSFIASPRPIYWVPGNHDIKLRHDTVLEGNTINILEKKKEVLGLTIKGVSLSVCYNQPSIAIYWDHMTAVKREEEKYYSTFLNEYVDIVVSHSPPSGPIGSEVECGDIGSECLLEYIEEYQPKLVICGHVHNPLCREQQIGNTLVMNVARTSKIIEYEELIK